MFNMEVGEQKMNSDYSFFQTRFYNSLTPRYASPMPSEVSSPVWQRWEEMPRVGPMLHVPGLIGTFSLEGASCTCARLKLQLVFAPQAPVGKGSAALCCRFEQRTRMDRKQHLRTERTTIPRLWDRTGLHPF